MLRALITEKLIRVGLVTIMFGTGPLVVSMILGPKANPIGLGILAMLSFWPGALMLLVGIVSVIVRRVRGTPTPAVMPIATTRATDSH